MIFGVDKGMSAGEWNAAKSLVNSLTGALQSTPPFYFFYKSVFEFNDLADIPVVFHIEPFPQIKTYLSAAPSGMTNFDSAIFRTVNLISFHRKENTCVIYISDGGSEISMP